MHSKNNPPPKQRVLTWREAREYDQGYEFDDREFFQAWPRRGNLNRAKWVAKQDKLKFKHCSMCGRVICVNNYDDKRSRTPQSRGLVFCVLCEPDRDVPVTNPRTGREQRRLRNTRKLFLAIKKQPCFKHAPHEGCKCLPCVAKRITPDPEQVNLEPFLMALIVKTQSRSGCWYMTDAPCGRCIGCLARLLFPKDGTFGDIQVQD